MSKNVVLLTGATRGLGRDTLLHLIRLHKVTHYVLVARDADKLEKVKNELQNLDGDVIVHTIVADLADPSMPEKIINETITNFGQIDTLFANAALSIKHTISSLEFSKSYTDSELFQMMQVNLMSNVQLAHYAIPVLRKTKGRMVFISSGAALNPRAHNGIYSATKAGLNTFVSCLALEEPDITVLAVNPGPTNTDMFQDTLKYERENTTSTVFQNMKMNDPKEVAKSFAALALHIPKEWSGKYVEWNDQKVLDLLPQIGL
jgi:short-subunit dehydrogenase